MVQDQDVSQIGETGKIEESIRAISENIQKSENGNGIIDMGEFRGSCGKGLEEWNIGTNITKGGGRLAITMRWKIAKSKNAK